MSRQPAGKPRDKRKGRRRIVPPPAAARARVAPISSATKVAESTSTTTLAAPARRVPGMMDFSYVGSEVRRIFVFMVCMLTLIIVLSLVFR